jgi:hypothetical protein
MRGVVDALHQKFPAQPAIDLRRRQPLGWQREHRQKWGEAMETIREGSFDKNDVGDIHCFLCGDAVVQLV